MEIDITSINFAHKFWSLILPIALMGLDILTGWLYAWRTNSLDSKKMREGLTKKVGELVYIAVGILLKYAIGLEPVAIFIVLYICLMEIVSLAENCDKLGIKMPLFLKEKVNNLNNKLNGKEDKD